VLAEIGTVVAIVVVLVLTLGSLRFWTMEVLVSVVLAEVVWMVVVVEVGLVLFSVVVLVLVVVEGIEEGLGFGVVIPLLWIVFGAFRLIRFHQGNRVEVGLEVVEVV
jgi:hypothetical protein